MSDYTFENYCVDENNKGAYMAMQRVTENPKDHGVICIWGGPGCGKTHLLRALTNALSVKNPEIKTLYVRGDEFVNDYIDYIRNPGKSDYKEKYSKLDVLIVDGIEILAGKEASQAEFQRFIHNSLEENIWMIFSLSWNPRWYENCQLITAGIVEKIGKLNTETLQAIAEQELKKRFTEDDNKESIEQIAVMITDHFNHNPRDIKGIASRVSFRVENTNDCLSIDAAKKSLDIDRQMFNEGDGGKEAKAPVSLEEKSRILDFLGREKNILKHEVIKAAVQKKENGEDWGF